MQNPNCCYGFGTSFCFFVPLVTVNCLATKDIREALTISIPDLVINEMYNNQYVSKCSIRGEIGEDRRRL